MPRNIFNWTFDEVTAFLKAHGFVLNYTNASHYYYRGHRDGHLRNVCVPYHGSKAIKPRTFKSIMLQSGIPREEWCK